ncbi:MAG: L-aspartate oxidase [Oscillospiraceae bacterium]|nr:L-aspartate oxidase [Oscillospiraceae bacterium]
MRRYLLSGPKRLELLRYDTVIIGSGIAGLYTALHLDRRLTCAILTKDTIERSNSYLAQGGVAAAVSPEDRPRFHYEDTLKAGAGLCDKQAVRTMVDEGPSDIAALIKMHVPFDLDAGGDLQAGREGGHGLRRIVHAHGDATGREMVKALAALAAGQKNITFYEHAFLIDILTGGGHVTGVVFAQNGPKIIVSNRVVICTGGVGQIYTHSTNSSVATGDGLAAAVRAGVDLTDMEFVQFHPTGLYTRSSKGSCFLISEAVRGEGGLLKNKNGRRFMIGQHPMQELAPRDIVTRCIAREMEQTETDHVFLDITGKPASFLSSRFPTIYNECLHRGIDMARDDIPVFPVQHYMMGGIKTDLNGMSSIPGLYACGEAARTGVHGANRLASNSMLECLVFGRRAASHISQTFAPAVNFEPPPFHNDADGTRGDAAAVKLRIQEIMSRDAWIIRCGKGLTEGLSSMISVKKDLEALAMNGPGLMEALNMATVSVEILKAALSREESVGAHYREDAVKCF